MTKAERLKYLYDLLKEEEHHVVRIAHERNDESISWIQHTILMKEDHLTRRFIRHLQHEIAFLEGLCES